MRHLVKAEPPPVLLENHEEWTARYLDAETTSPWRNVAIKAALIAETGGRCAYCDSMMLAVSPGDVEHIIPRKSRPDLVVDWDNLTLACSRCNNKKREYFSAEHPLLNPYKDDPREHLRFVGDMVLAVPGSERGKLSILKMNLHRQTLNRAREKRIKYVAALVENWATAKSEIIKQVLVEFILDDLLEGEYYESVRAYLLHEKFPVPVDR